MSKRHKHFIKAALHSSKCFSRLYKAAGEVDCKLTLSDLERQMNQLLYAIGKDILTSPDTLPPTSTDMGSVGPPGNLPQT